MRLTKDMWKFLWFCNVAINGGDVLIQAAVWYKDRM